MIRRHTFSLLLALLTLTASPALAQADFGLVPGSPTVTAENRDGTIDTQAGSHPYAFKVHFALRTGESGATEGGALRDTLTNLPPGLFGNPAAVPACPREAFEGALPRSCGPGTQIGMLRVLAPELHGELFLPLFNLEPPPGVAAQFGAAAVGFVAELSASIDPDNGYAVHIATLNAPIEVAAVTATIWGIPADPSHNPERGVDGGQSTDSPLLPFLTLPTSCELPPQVSFEVDSKLAPGLFVGGDEPAVFRDKGGNPIPLSGCDAVPFSPSVLAAPSSLAAESSSGFGFQLKLPNKALLANKEGAVTETEPEKTVVTLPKGITVNPAAANGMGACTLQQYEETSCPGSSKLGTLVAQTPLLEEAIEGSVYLAAPHDNPFDSLLGLYIIARAPQRGVVVKQAGLVEADPATGQLTTTIEGLPPVPYSGFDLRLREGARAPLITPQACGSYETTALLYPFSDPGTATVRTAPFTISSGANGGACVSSEAQMPNAPTMSAGSIVTLGGAYSPFVFRLNREDGSQRFSSVVAEPPAGLVAKLAGIPYCSESGIATASSRTNEGDGAVELASPSCPAASQVGTVLAGAGAGPTPYMVQGKAYLAGPYKGAPLSLEIVTPAIAGPFDLGVVAARAGIYVNEETAKIAVKSDALPTILHGLPLDVRSVSVLMDRQDFTLNPTSCEPTTVGGSLTSLTGAIAPLSQRFQVGGCRGLEFKPTLKLSLKGPTKRAGHPTLGTVLTFPSQGSSANIAKAAVTLPHSEIIDPQHVGNPCTRPQFAEEKCPKISILGRARAWTPLLDEPLEGKVYFRSNGGERELPDVVADLRGQIHIVLVGAVDTVSPMTNARIRTTFFQAPDAPVSKFTLDLKGGKEGLLVNSENLCRSNQRAVVKLVAQNGKVTQTQPKIDNSCGGKKGKR